MGFVQIKKTIQQCIRTLLNSSSYTRLAHNSPNSRRRYETEIKRFLHWNPRPLKEITTEHLEQYQTYLAESPRMFRNKAAGPLKPGTINSACSIIQSFLTWLLKTGHEDFRADNFKHVIEPLKACKPEIRILTRDELNQIWQVLEHLEGNRLRDKALIHVLKHGLTIEEIINLNISSFANQRLSVMTSRTREVRSVPLEQSSSLVLENYLNQLYQQRKLHQNNELLFTYCSFRHMGEPMTETGIRKVVREIGELANVRNLNPIDFRQTYTAALVQKFPPLQVIEWTGYGWKELERYFSIKIPQELLNAEYEQACGHNLDHLNIQEKLLEIMERPEQPRRRKNDRSNDLVDS